MSEINATILIPDISGFITLKPIPNSVMGLHTINMLIDAIPDAIGDEYEVSEIEGDAVLLIKKGQPR